MPEPGERVAGRYVIERIVAEGGFGVVVAARHVELEERVAIKFLKPEVAHVPDVIARFAREAKACASVRSEHTPIVHDVGMSDERGPYIVMEYLEGEDLLALVRRRGPLPMNDASELVLQACEAIVAAHAKGIVHRDIKPENLFLARRTHGPDVLKVLDFGISKAALTGEVFGTKLSLLKTQNLVGTPLYMSPEQLRGKGDVGPRSDVWSLGAVLYELVTGRTAFDGFSVTEVCATVLEAEPAPPAAAGADLPEAFVGVVMRCLRKKAEERFAGVGELAAALEAFAPVRARASVERTLAIARSAGLMEGEEGAHADAGAHAHEHANDHANAMEQTSAPTTESTGAGLDAQDTQRSGVVEGAIEDDAASRDADTSRSMRIVLAAAACAAAVIIIAGNGMLAARAERAGVTVRDTPANDDEAEETVSAPLVRLPTTAATTAPRVATATGPSPAKAVAASPPDPAPGPAAAPPVAAPAALAAAAAGAPGALATAAANADTSSTPPREATAEGVTETP